MEPLEIIAIADRLTNIIILTLATLQEISGKTKEEILADIEAKSAKTDELLEKLR